MVNRLVELGVEDAADCFGPTALHIGIYGTKIDVVRALIQGRSDLDTLDPFGYSPLEWAFRTPELSYTNTCKPFCRRRIPKRKPTRRAKRNSVILEAIQQFKQYDQGPSEWAISVLGRLLLFNGDESNACFALWQGMQMVDGSINHSIWCNLCGPEKEILGTRYICRQCPEVDLCHSCMEVYGMHATVPGCCNHAFLSFPKAEKCDLAAKSRSMQKLSLGKWLDQLWIAYKNKR
ncbi:hypothetical protein DL98DRAFT_18677 [Cadophora sp. DSE1049]|nr:hypothetical protein DL98DRAFT_18677 [Cadophora sp. DSE1049]